MGIDYQLDIIEFMSIVSVEERRNLKQLYRWKNRDLE